MKTFNIEKFFMVMALIATLGSLGLNYIEGGDYIWQIVCTLWILTSWTKTNRIENLENQ